MQKTIKNQESGCKAYVARQTEVTPVLTGECEMTDQRQKQVLPMVNASDAVILAGASNAGKSIVALQMAMYIAKGRRGNNEVAIVEPRVHACVSESMRTPKQLL